MLFGTLVDHTARETTARHDTVVRSTSHAAKAENIRERPQYGDDDWDDCPEDDWPELPLLRVPNEPTPGDVFAVTGNGFEFDNELSRGYTSTDDLRPGVLMGMTECGFIALTSDGIPVKCMCVVNRHCRNPWEGLWWAGEGDLVIL